MTHQDVPVGANPPDEINIIVEIQKGGGKNKYEMDKDSGRLTLDRVNATTMTYPADYGYLPGTLCEDGDPLDALLIIDESAVHGSVVPARPVGVLYMVDEGEGDEKLICVPLNDNSKAYIKDLSDLGGNFQHQVEHFYRHYKDWKNDWQGVQIEFKGWGDATEARQIIQESIKRAQSSH